MRFGNQSDLAELRRWSSPTRLRANPHVSDALEYARLASKRWAYYHRNDETATGLPEFRAAIRRNPRAEVAIMLVARAGWQPDPKLLGLVYCRRSWCRRLIVDFVAVHPHIVGRLRERIRASARDSFTA